MLEYIDFDTIDCIEFTQMPFVIDQPLSNWIIIWKLYA